MGTAAFRAGREGLHEAVKTLPPELQPKRLVRRVNRCDSGRSGRCAAVSVARSTEKSRFLEISLAALARFRLGRPGPPEIGSRVCRVSSHDDGMAERSGPLTEFNEAAIEWAAGGRGQGLVDAAAIALAEGLDSKTLRVLAGAPRRFADEK